MVHLLSMPVLIQFVKKLISCKEVDKFLSQLSGIVFNL